MNLTDAIDRIKDLIPEASNTCLERKGGIVLTTQDIAALQVLLLFAQSQTPRSNVSINGALVDQMLGRPVDWEKTSWTLVERGAFREDPDIEDPEPFI